MKETTQNVLLSTLIMVFAGSAVFMGVKGVKDWRFLKKNKVIVEDYEKSIDKLNELEALAENKNADLKHLFRAARKQLSLVGDLLADAKDQMDDDILEAAKNNLEMAKETLNKIARILAGDFLFPYKSFYMPAYPTFPAVETASIIRSKRFHFSVRNGKRWFTHR